MNTEYSAHYASFHPETEEHDKSLKVILGRWLGPHLPSSKDSAILDVGCGRGYALRFLAELGYANAQGIDTDAGQVEFARGKKLRVTRVEDSARYLGENPGPYDLILLMDVLEHLTDTVRSALLSSIHGALRPGGHLICTVPNACNPIAGYFRYVDYSHQTSYTRESLESVLRHASLKVESIKGAEFFVRPRLLFWLPSRRTLQWLLQRLTRVHARAHYVAEMGIERGWTAPLAPNLIAVATRE